MTVLALEGHRRTDWEGQAHLEWKRLISKSDAVFSGHPGTRDYLLGRSGNTPEEFLKSFGKFKPCLHGSDAHSFDGLFKPSLDRFMWVKGETTFAGLRQVLYEPDSRVIISSSQPDTNRSGYTLTGVTFQNPVVSNSVTLSSKPVPLNHGLVAVIGGKGSGKTALLDLIAHCFEDRCHRGKKERRESSSFVQRIERDQPNLETSVRFLKGEQWSKRLSDNAIFDRIRVTYLPQGKIDDYSADTQKLHRKITDLVFSTENVAASGLVEEYYELGKSAQKIQTEITETLGSVESYESETTEDQRVELSRAVALKRGELDDLTRLRDNHLIDEDHKRRVEKLGEIVNTLDSKNKEFDSIRGNVKQVERDLPNIAEMNEWVSQLSNRLQETGWESHLPVVDYSNLENALAKAHLHLSSLSEDNLVRLGDHRKELANLSQNQKEHSELLDQIEQKQREITLSEDTLKNFDMKRADTEASKQHCSVLHQECLNEVHKQRNTYQLIINLFSEEKDEIMRSVEFEAYVAFDRDDFIEAAQELFHGRSVSEDDLCLMADALEEFGQSPSDTGLAEAYFSSVMKFAKKLKPKRTQADLYRLMHRSVFRVETNVLFDGKAMESLSMGQKGTVLLTIFLAEGEHLLILDQPEENLDNRFVYEVLVGAIRAAKQRRQIIMATHNANLVVNTDAEQVIVANYDDGVIDYLCGALENREIRSEVTTLLEGGEEAFRRREQRYSS